ncbi:hypothetical protein SAMN05216360_11081 [Methylobacterium phyllostachyos]|uniref:Uncharacterized protein n=1 Tax=Methylobacterium phyllostachyos TaxID=582672 RepID=A0A1H0DA91_9HYPH|nr:hypothetical protein [Methylobacterium phyllostachyos]SDN67060.1 hypothetical protein SAMN05216360_11081 [Methylobacterium phyllostachyos]
MRRLPRAIAASLVLFVLLPATAEARPHRRALSHAMDTDHTIARMAARDRQRGDWRVWQETRPLARIFAPATRERVAAPPFTGWGYGGTIPGAPPGF